ncbi:hypothetical protein M501DRAFT_996913 [Patellaria atrata CBS 101060]|uniref:Uncharacterized protein n=1 Tax=Patellaria atrata CBS 101060 TaxID=1346257 RepID=A0A9P4VM27_9PEZI|nr:hypothetical protein M501DRAFT_996913 [Patellaria atrata CBS 101060]
MELRVHISASSSRNDDERYRAQAIAYLNFESINIIPLTTGAQGCNDESNRASEIETREEHNSTIANLEPDDNASFDRSFLPAETQCSSFAGAITSTPQIRNQDPRDQESKEEEFDDTEEDDSDDDIPRGSQSSLEKFEEIQKHWRNKQSLVPPRTPYNGQTKGISSFKIDTPDYIDDTQLAAAFLESQIPRFTIYEDDFDSSFSTEPSPKRVRLSDEHFPENEHKPSPQLVSIAKPITPIRKFRSKSSSVFVKQTSERNAKKASSGSVDDSEQLAIKTSQPFISTSSTDWDVTELVVENPSQEIRGPVASPIDQNAEKKQYTSDAKHAPTADEPEEDYLPSSNPSKRLNTKPAPSVDQSSERYLPSSSPVKSSCNGEGSVGISSDDTESLSVNVRYLDVRLPIGSEVSFKSSSSVDPFTAQPSIPVVEVPNHATLDFWSTLVTLPSATARIEVDSREVDVDGKPFRVSVIDFSLLPINICGPAPETSLEPMPTKHQVPSRFRDVMAASSVVQNYRIRRRIRDVHPWERCYWQVDTADWPKEKQLEFWDYIYMELKTQDVGWGLEACRIPPENDSKRGLGIVWLHCWGDMAMPVWLWLFVGGYRNFKRSCTELISARDMNVVIFMD